MPYPAYIQNCQSGRLRKKLQSAEAILGECTFCPRSCRVNRLLNEMSTCQIGRLAKVAAYTPHFGEEKILTGKFGSGAIFFSGCNLRCRFCQNWEVSHEQKGQEVSPEELADMMVELQDAGCDNINLVTPSHVIPQILEAVIIAAAKGLKIPLIYNTSAYDSKESLRLMDGVIDIYLPDFKFFDPGLAATYLKAPDYPETAKAAIMEMHRQVGNLEVDKGTGLAKRGVLIRHLVLPNCLEDSRKIFNWITENLSVDSYIDIMDQYSPAGDVAQDASERRLFRHLTIGEFREAVKSARLAGLTRIDEAA